ncbi:MAG: hypothetical protein LBQ12_01590, partial [Deltaproteobacteria bacterium]|nr:hypothetical protein [Deltaproteobacteria bacterium]
MRASPRPTPDAPALDRLIHSSATVLAETGRMERGSRKRYQITAKGTRFHTGGGPVGRRADPSTKRPASSAPRPLNDMPHPRPPPPPPPPRGAPRPGAQPAAPPPPPPRP